jgi:uncharacterized membrane protein YsdA (DUF1294 family)
MLDNWIWIGAIVIIITNFINCILFGIDKKNSLTNQNRIKESTLILFSLFAPLGGYFGMKIFQHKTKKIKFKVLIMVFIILHILGGILLFNLISSA